MIQSVGAYSPVWQSSAASATQSSADLSSFAASFLGNASATGQTTGTGGTSSPLSTDIQAYFLNLQQVGGTAQTATGTPGTDPDATQATGTQTAGTPGGTGQVGGHHHHHHHGGGGTGSLQADASKVVSDLESLLGGSSAGSGSTANTAPSATSSTTAASTAGGSDSQSIANTLSQDFLKALQSYATTAQTTATSTTTV